MGDIGGGEAACSCLVGAKFKLCAAGAMASSSCIALNRTEQFEI